MDGNIDLNCNNLNHISVYGNTNYNKNINYSNNSNFILRPEQINQHYDYSKLRKPIQAQQPQRKSAGNYAFNKLMDLACGSMNSSYNRQQNYNQSQFNNSTLSSNQKSINRTIANRPINYFSCQNYTMDHTSNLGQNYPPNQHIGVFNNNNQQTDDHLPRLRSIRAPKNKVACKSLLPEININYLIEQCYEHLTLLKREVIHLNNKLSGIECISDEVLSSLSLVDQTLTLEDMVDLSFQEFDKIDKMIKDHSVFFDTFNNLFQTSFCTFQIWFNQMQAVRYASKKTMIKLKLDNLDAETSFNSSLESTGSNSTEIADVQLYNHIHQLLRCTRDVRTSVWCISIIAANQQIYDKF